MQAFAGLFFLLLPLLVVRCAALLISLSRRQRANLEGVRL